MPARGLGPESTLHVIAPATAALVAGIIESRVPSVSRLPGPVAIVGWSTGLIRHGVVLAACVLVGACAAFSFDPTALLSHSNLLRSAATLRVILCRQIFLPRWGYITLRVGGAVVFAYLFPIITGHYGLDALLGVRPSKVRLSA